MSIVNFGSAAEPKLEVPELSDRAKEICTYVRYQHPYDSEPGLASSRRLLAD